MDNFNNCIIFYDPKSGPTFINDKLMKEIKTAFDVSDDKICNICDQ